MGAELWLLGGWVARAGAGLGKAARQNGIFEERKCTVKASQNAMNGIQKFQFCEMKGHVLRGLTDQDDDGQLASSELQLFRDASPSANFETLRNPPGRTGAHGHHVYRPHSRASAVAWDAQPAVWGAGSLSSVAPCARLPAPSPKAPAGPPTC
ncbi:unnamed protein product [Rangifer tarandus platyrhynchus]|uniref:Uncharacterized protein n=2 Tax=Rangifer tarandus platyrhynchus TaxID=3082113 RepID=A0ACB0EZJ1_RANTA|nr:unnamed protein product [Rangifer tarandus platyrhynchus]CAI9706160.1 unnamed protein product [Rangifer tarandus platyrhynchus]